MSRLSVFLLVGLMMSTSCANRPSAPLPCSPREFRETIPSCAYRIAARYPHDYEAFTQGLVYEYGALYEGTGLRGESTLRKVDLATGGVMKSVALDPRYFGEGITIFGDRIIQLTLSSGVGFVYDLESLLPVRQFDLSGEGWGITHDGRRLILSDGSANLRFLDPQTFEQLGDLVVTDAGRPVNRINELEYVRGEIFANIWQTDLIARISPQTGVVVGWIDLAGLLSLEDRTQSTDVLNGIAYDAEGDRLFVTGKRWPWLFEIELMSDPK